MYITLKRYKFHLTILQKNDLCHLLNKINYMKRQKLQATIEIIDERQGILYIISDKIRNYQNSAIYRNTFLQSEDRTSYTLYKDQKPHDGCKAIEPLYSCFNVSALKFKMQLRISTPCPMLMRTGGPDMMTRWHIINPTIDVKLLKFQCASREIIIGNFKIQKHIQSGTMEHHKDH